MVSNPIYLLNGPFNHKINKLCHRLTVEIKLKVSSSIGAASAAYPEHYHCCELRSIYFFLGSSEVDGSCRTGGISPVFLL